MAIKIFRAFVKEDIREGFGTVKCRTGDGEPYWVLPGGETTRSREQAILHAKRMDKLIRNNLKRTGKTLI